jgi:hypothetical protein
MADEIIFRLRRWLQAPGNSLGSEIQEVTADLQMSFKKTIPANETDAQIDVELTLENCVVIGVIADHDCTVKVNSTSPMDPLDTIALVANRALLWVDGDPDGYNPFAQDVTTLFVTTGTADTLLRLVAGVNATPDLED